MQKLKLHSPDLTQANIEKVGALFPGCIVEARDDKGEVTRSIDFDQLRQELAEHYLLRSDLAIQDIASYLGFTESRSFHRSFKSWTGMTPGEYRQNARQP